MTPPANATDVALYPHVALTWSLEEENVVDETYDIYIGKDTLPKKAVYTDLTVTSYNIPFENLESNTLYLWKIVAKEGTKNYVSETYSFTTSSQVQVTGEYGNGPYIWFDITLGGPQAVVDFLAVKTEETPSKTRNEVVTMEDKDSSTTDSADAGYNPLDGMHFRDTLKSNEVHRIILYDLEPSTEYTIYAYFSDDSEVVHAVYSKFDGKALSKITTADTLTALGEVDWPAYVGQKVIISQPSSEPIPSGEAHKWSSFNANHLFLLTSQIALKGLSYSSIYENISCKYIPGHVYFLKFTEIRANQTDFYVKISNPDDPKKAVNRINLQVNENL